MKIYTKKGDDGSTGLLGGARVPKYDRAIEACGAVDETNVVIGLAVAACDDEEMIAALRRIQTELFMAGARLADSDGDKTTDRLDASHVARLEQEIDAATAQVPPLRSFVLPGGCEQAARLHQARTVCRRAERAVVALARDRAVDQSVLAYLNRLSDLLFTLARLANQRGGVEETPWGKPRG